LSQGIMAPGNQAAATVSTRSGVNWSMVASSVVATVIVLFVIYFVLLRRRT
jgi:hypothetical protein